MQSLLVRHGIATTKVASLEQAASLMALVGTRAASVSRPIADLQEHTLKSSPWDGAAKHLVDSLQDAQLHAASRFPAAGIKTFGKLHGFLRFYRMISPEDLKMVRRFCDAASVVKHFDWGDFDNLMARIWVALDGDLPKPPPPGLIGQESMADTFSADEEGCTHHSLETCSVACGTDIPVLAALEAFKLDDDSEDVVGTFDSVDGVVALAIDAWESYTIPASEVVLALVDDPPVASSVVATFGIDVVNEVCSATAEVLEFADSHPECPHDDDDEVIDTFLDSLTASAVAPPVGDVMIPQEVQRSVPVPLHTGGNISVTEIGRASCRERV